MMAVTVVKIGIHIRIIFIQSDHHHRSPAYQHTVFTSHIALHYTRSTEGSNECTEKKNGIN